jgi:hypothetical protein
MEAVCKALRRNFLPGVALELLNRHAPRASTTPSASGKGQGPGDSVPEGQEPQPGCSKPGESPVTACLDEPRRPQNFSPPARPSRITTERGWTGKTVVNDQGDLWDNTRLRRSVALQAKIDVARQTRDRAPLQIKIKASMVVPDLEGFGPSQPLKPLWALFPRISTG